MSHGAAGFAYALALLAAATGREEFAQAAAECIAFENSSYDPGRSNWPDLRGVEPSWLCQWCYVVLTRSSGPNSTQKHLYMEYKKPWTRTPIRTAPSNWLPA